MEFPEGLAVDWVSRNLYWSDSGKRTIEVVNLDTKIRATVFEYLIRNPRGIAVHPSIGLDNPSKNTNDCNHETSASFQT